MGPRFDPTDIAGWCGARWSKQPAGLLAGVFTDTRAPVPGGLFVALRGERFDGHGFVGKAFEAGAAGAVVESGRMAGDWPDWPLLGVSDTREALCRMARCHRRKSGAHIVGVTGSAGKTTVKELIAEMLGRKASTARTPGNWNNDIGLPLSILGMPSDAVYGVFELGINHPGEMSALCAIAEPTWGVVTNVGAVHIEFFGTTEAIAREKSRILACLPVDGLAVLSSETLHLDLLRGAAGCRVLTAGFDSGADYRVCGDASEDGAFDLLERASGERVRLVTKLPGRHNLVNIAQAVAVARSAGIDWAGIDAALRSYKPMAMRWQAREWGGVVYVNDAYNANPLSMRAALRTFEDWGSYAGRWLVLGEMFELGAASEREHVELGRYAAAGPWCGIVAVGGNAPWICRGIRDGGFGGEMWECADATSAWQVIGPRVKPGDVVLLKGSRGVRLERFLESAENETKGGTV